MSYKRMSPQPVSEGGTGLNFVTAHSIMVGSGNTITLLPAGTNGQVLLGATGQDPAFSTLTSIGGTVVFTPGVNTLNLEVAGGGSSWSREANSAVSLASNHGYVNTNVALTTFTLPLTAALGTEIQIVGESAGLWTLAQNAGQQIQYGNQNTTLGVGGSLTATNRYDTVSIVCRVTNTTWSVVKSVGILNIV